MDPDVARKFFREGRDTRIDRFTSEMENMYYYPALKYYKNQGKNAYAVTLDDVKKFYEFVGHKTKAGNLVWELMIRTIDKIQKMFSAKWENNKKVFNPKMWNKENITPYNSRNNTNVIDRNFDKDMFSEKSITNTTQEPNTGEISPTINQITTGVNTTIINSSNISSNVETRPREDWQNISDSNTETNEINKENNKKSFTLSKNGFLRNLGLVGFCASLCFVVLKQLKSLFDKSTGYNSSSKKVIN